MAPSWIPKVYMYSRTCGLQCHVPRVYLLDRSGLPTFGPVSLNLHVPRYFLLDRSGVQTFGSVAPASSLLFLVLLLRGSWGGGGASPRVPLGSGSPRGWGVAWASCLPASRCRPHRVVVARAVPGLTPSCFPNPHGPAVVTSRPVKLSFPRAAVAPPGRET